VTVSEFQIHEVTKEELQQIAVVGTHLHKWQGESTEDIQSVFKQQALVQLDPLNPAGRNHDLFFQSRIKNYEIDTFQKIVYPKKLVFEAYFPNLMAISKEHFPLFLSQMKEEFLHKYYQSRLEKVEKIHSGILEEAVKFLQENGPSKASDIGEMAKIKPDFSFWKTSNLAGMSLEILWILGRVIISGRDENWRKTYYLTEEYFESELLEKTDLTHEEISYEKFLIKQKSYPLITLGKVSISKAGSLFVGKRKRISPEWFRTNYSENGPHILKTEGEQWGIAVPYNWKDFLKVDLDDNMRAIAPLDPLIWDRDLTLKVFDFDYVWEVYKIPKDRKWGYYVYPLLFQGKLIGRTEVNYDKKTLNLEFFNLQLEESFELDNCTENAFINLTERWKNMLKAKTITSDRSIKFIN